MATSELVRGKWGRGQESLRPFCNEEKRHLYENVAALCVEADILDYVCIVLWNSTCAEDSLKRALHTLYRTHSTIPFHHSSPVIVVQSS